jgi:hypothetical protein
MKAVQDHLFPHLEIEDKELLPAAAASVPAKEWDDLSEAALRAVPKSDLPIVAGAMDEIVRSLPPERQPPPPPLPIRVLTALFWRRKYAKFIAPLDAHAA